MPLEDLQEIVEVVGAARTQGGARLLDLLNDSPLLLVFLRHAGCTFCREALADVAAQRAEIEKAGRRIVLVHMGDTAAMAEQLGIYGLTGIDCIRDAGCRLYRAFGLKRGNAMQLFGAKVFWRALGEGVLARHGIGSRQADSLQMPGVFLMNQNGIVTRYRHRSAADRPNYAALAAGTTTAAE